MIDSRDPAPQMRAFLSGNGHRPNAAPVSPGSLQRLEAALGAAHLYHDCHRPATMRLGIATLLALGGAMPLLLRLSRRWKGHGDEKSAGTRHGGFGYQPALDGLRAVAILWVLATHTGLKGVFRTGDHGVDLFFVLSGFLITTLLLHEHTSKQRVDLRRFYIRRALRLLPVVLVALVIGTAAHLVNPHWFWTPGWSGLVAISLYASNWLLLMRPTALGFLTPTWSLAIEEQFYLVWPPILAAMLTSGRRRHQVAIFAGFGAIASALYRYSTTAGATGPSPSYSWYYDSLKRADALLIGALLAALLSPQVLARLRRLPQLVLAGTWMAIAGVASICAMQLLVQDQSFLPSWGLVVIEVCFALIVCSLVALPSTPMAVMLSVPWLVWLGRRSYGLYVLHLPVFVLLQGTHLVPGRYPLIVAEILLSVAAAALSYRFIEAPALRLKHRYSAFTSPNGVSGGLPSN